MSLSTRKLLSDYFEVNILKDVLDGINEHVSGSKEQLISRISKTWKEHNRNDYELLGFLDKKLLQGICYYYKLDDTPANKSTYIRRIKKAGLLDKNLSKPGNLKQETKLQKIDKPVRDVNINIWNIHLSKNSKIGIVIGIASVVATIIGIILSNGFE